MAGCWIQFRIIICVLLFLGFNKNKSEYFSVQLENVLLKFPPKKLSIQKIRLERKKIIANVPFDIGGGYP